MRKDFYIEENSSNEWIFYIIFIIITITLFILGNYFYQVKYNPKKRKTVIAQLNATITNSAPQKKVKKKVKKIKKKTPKKKKIIKKPKVAKEIKPDITPPKQEKKVVRKKIRRVYGVRRVFAKGIGDNGNIEDAVISKKGNTLDKEVDTLKATEDDLKGKIVSVGNITSAPKIKRLVKPKYTKEMIKNSIEGVIRAKVLVDIDGKVKKIKILNDLGFGSKNEVIKAAKQLVFVPAKINNEAVAVWITIKFPFRLIDS